jgi:phosphate transport system substrate-binding protein
VRRLALAVATFALCAGAADAQWRGTIQIAGSSTVLPFASIVAEEFGYAFPRFRTPVVASGGSGGGLRQFCQGTGPHTIDIANSSRPIRPAEIESCNRAGVKDTQEIMFGYDGLVFASRADRAGFELTPQQVFAAIASGVPRNGAMSGNPYGRWSQIDPSLPDQDIVLVIPASNHGTREVFEETVILPGCKAFPEYAALEGDAHTAACLSFRQDGRVIEVAGDYTETLARLDAQPEAVGLFGLSFYDQNRDRLRVATVDGVLPSLETIASGEYPVSRPLYFYVKGEHIGWVPGIEEYVVFFLSDPIAGEGGILEEAGLIPARAEERNEVLGAFRERLGIRATH